LEEENFTTEEIDKTKKKKTNKKQQKIEVSPTLNFVISTYYKGTGIETVLQKLEKNLDEASVSTSEISNI
jgi:hypothetical protein